jgi:alpha-1,3-mannosyltransferase
MRTVNELVRDSNIIHIHDLRFALEILTVLGAVHDVPLVLSSHGLVFHTRRYRLAKELLWRSYYRALLSRFTVIACVSDEDASTCRRAGITRNVRILPNPVATERFNTSPAGPGSGALLYFGRLAPNKAIERLAGVLRVGPRSWTLTIAGSGDSAYVGRLRATFESFGQRCRFVGTVSDAELPALIASHDCVVLPSRTEGFGLTLVEAMAAGVPIAASDIPTYADIARDSPVELVDFDQPTRCVERIEHAMASWDSELARRRASSFSWDRSGPAFIDLYRSLA